MLPNQVKVIEVGPRDGLQNHKEFVPTSLKLELIRKLADSGLRSIEVSSFVNPKWIPQFSDAAKVFSELQLGADIAYFALVPNKKGLQHCIQAGVKHIAVFGAASETFSKKNINCSIDESLKRFESVISEAHRNGISVRGYISCVLGCPYEGEIEENAVCDFAKSLISLGCYEVSLGDTIGVGTPLKARRLIERVAGKVPINQLAVHFHDTYGQALANIFACLEAGISTVDASIAGLGGCPYADGATGNVSTEDLVYMLNGLKIDTGLNLNSLVEAGWFITDSMNIRNNSRLGAVHRNTK